MKTANDKRIEYLIAQDYALTEEDAVALLVELDNLLPKNDPRRTNILEDSGYNSVYKKAKKAENAKRSQGGVSDK